MLRLFNRIKTIIPKISDTELIALRSGTTCIDTDIFRGKVDTSSIKPKSFERKFENKKIDDLINKYGNIEQVYPSEKQMKY